MRLMNRDSKKPSLKIGTRVFHRRFRTRDGIEHGGWFGTVLTMPPELGGPPAIPRGLFGVLRDDGALHGLDASLLEVCAEAEHGLHVAVERVRARRADLFDEMVSIVAPCRRADLDDPLARQQVELEVEKLSRGWYDAHRASLGEFCRNPDSRERLSKCLDSYVELAHLIDQLDPS